MRERECVCVCVCGVLVIMPVLVSSHSHICHADHLYCLVRPKRVSLCQHVLVFLHLLQHKCLHS